MSFVCGDAVPSLGAHKGDPPLYASLAAMLDRDPVNTPGVQEYRTSESQKSKRFRNTGLQSFRVQGLEGSGIQEYRAQPSAFQASLHLAPADGLGTCVRSGKIGVYGVKDIRSQMRIIRTTAPEMIAFTVAIVLRQDRQRQS